MGYLDSNNISECFGCEACVNVCNKSAIFMKEDSEGFRYPEINVALCINCGLCRKACPYDNTPIKHKNEKYAFGGYNNDASIRFDSTSGGAFSAIVDTFCVENYVVFGAEAKGLTVFHGYTTEKGELHRFRKSKYSQSIIGSTYKKVKEFLLEGKIVLFSGTPCQIAGLISYLDTVNFKLLDNLLTVEVVCEGVPSPLYIRKMDAASQEKMGGRIESLDYRYTGKSILGHGKWDFEIMRIVLENKAVLQRDRWFNPFWSIWLNRLMSRPSCYECPFAETGRCADITLGDLWGVHLYCPELYGHNGGASLVIGNTEKGKLAVKKAEQFMYGHELSFEEALKYQGPLRKHIEISSLREVFMNDLKSEMCLADINHKWAKKPTLKLLWQKYVWGNRQKEMAYNIKQNFMKG